MCADSEGGRFEVGGHLELTSRGAFVFGKVIDGIVRRGMRANTGLMPAALTINAVEFVDNVSEQRHWNAIAFAECPTLEFVKRVFTIGALVEFVADDGKTG